MNHLLLPIFLFWSVFGLTQGTKKTTPVISTKAPERLYAVFAANANLANTNVDTTYLSSSDFSGTGTIDDPIRVKTSVITSWLQSLPGYVNDGSKYLASDFSWKTIQTTSTLPQLFAPVLTATAVSSSSIALTWTDVPNESSYLLQRSQDNVSWTTIATPGVNATAFNDNGLAASTLYYYRIKSVGDNSNYSDSPYGKDNEATLPGSATPSSETIFFDVNNAYQIEQHPDGPGVYYSSQGNGVAKAVKKLPAGADGLVYFQYVAGSGELLSLGYTNSSGLAGYDHWIGGVYIFGTEVKAYGYNGSATDLGATAVNNHFYGFRRNNGAIEIVTSADEKNWTVLGQSNFSPDDLYIDIYLQLTESKIKVLGQNLVSY